MTTADLILLAPVLTTAVIAVIHALKSPQERREAAETHLQVGELGKQLNGRLAELLEATRQAAWHAGLLEGARLTQAGRRLPRYDTPEPPDEEPPHGATK